ncbi:FxDxF family PEP-CTERM protein [Massilia sp. METH4]|uniref:FxDxF family PEP-CTERM protein n=1 Tax=Massilia sp. METH4 TaxID=3123041 RepID=UPI0030D071DE
MKKLLQFCLVAALAIGAQAHASYIDNSQTFNQTVVQDGSEGAFAFDRTIVTDAGSLGASSNGFADRYAFSLDAASYFGGDLSSVLYPNGTGLVITSFTLHEADGDLLYSASLVDARRQAWAFLDDATLSNGSYFLQVNGYATAASGSYSGNLAVSAVPEPGSLALMFGGLTVLGVALRRRA